MPVCSEAKLSSVFVDIFKLVRPGTTTKFKLQIIDFLEPERVAALIVIDPSAMAAR
jgi:hypothetical protein